MDTESEYFLSLLSLEGDLGVKLIVIDSLFQMIFAYFQFHSEVNWKGEKKKMGIKLIAKRRKKKLDQL
jgi:hypothetical protein